MGKKKNVSKQYCRDCSHAYEPHAKNYRGEYFLCRCPFFNSSRFLNLDNCENFSKKVK